MKKHFLSLAAMVCIAAASHTSCNGQKKAPIYEPVRTVEPATHAPHDSTRYKKDQIIVIYKGKPDPAKVTDLKNKINGPKFDASKLTTRPCRSCNGYIELWEAPKIETRIHADGLVAGTVGPKPHPVGEDAIAYYSLNFMQEIPVEPTEINFKSYKFDSLKNVVNNRSGKEVIRVAVIDTGIDTNLVINPSYLWTNQATLDGNDDENCYKGDRYGWNFIEDNSNLHDDDPNLHGTLVSQYIINEFAASTINAVEIMPLKTHDKHGNGDLFSAICAIRYAMENGAKIINASWGFYYYDDDPHPYLSRLITQELREKGILFVAAAGNRTTESDKYAHKAYRQEHGGTDIPDDYLRNLEYHNFYPACLSRKHNNVITATTANNKRVSPTQNYSNQFVDLGAFPDDVNTNSMRFKLPFGRGPAISGSSFAAAIVTGRLGATLPLTSYAPGLDKRDLLPQMDTAPTSARSSVLEPEHIRYGRITKHH